MFGRGRRKARAAQAIEVQVDAPTGFVEAAPEAAASTRAAPSDVPSEMDATFTAMMAQLDDSLAAMARACDRIEEAVAGGSRHHPAVADTAAAA